MNNNLHGRVVPGRNGRQFSQRPPLELEPAEKPFPWSNPKNSFMWGVIFGMGFITMVYTILLTIIL